MSLSKLFRSASIYTAALGLFVGLGGVEFYSARADVAAIQVEPQLDPAAMELHPIVEVIVPRDADNRFVVITNHQGQMVGIGFHGSYGAPENFDLRASLSEIRAGKTLKIGDSKTPFLNIGGAYFNTDGGVLELSAPDGTLKKYLHVFKDHGMWQVQESRWDGQQWIDDRLINTVSVEFSFIHRRVSAMNLSEENGTRLRWESMQTRGYYQTYQSRPKLDPPADSSAPDDSNGDSK